jgi:glycosyltransferase involved in cell wall biosynthesis
MSHPNFPSLAVIIPVFNGMPFLPEAVGSVFSQSVPNFHLYLVDDRSIDRSLDFIRGISDPRVTYSQNPKNIGLYPSLVGAIRRCKEDWICILMQDDYLYPSYLAEMSNLIEKYSDIPLIWATEDAINHLGEPLRPGRNTSREEPIRPGPEPWRNVLYSGCIWTISGSMTRRQLFLTEPFREDLPHRGDYEWFLRVIRRYECLYYEKPLLALRAHAGQASATHLADGIDIRETVAIFKDQFTQHESDLTVVHALRIVTRYIRMIARRALRFLWHKKLSKAKMVCLDGCKLISLLITYKSRKL